MANNRNLDINHEKNEEAKLNERPNQLLILLPEYHISIKPLADKGTNFSYDFSLLKELNKAPQRQYENVDQSSMQSSQFGILPEELVVLIYSFLDVKSLLQLSIACKLLGIIANESLIRERLYKAKNHFQLFKMIDKDSSLINPTIPNFLVNINNSSPIQMREPSTETYNDHPDLGFVIRK